MEPQTPRGAKPGEVSRLIRHANSAKKRGDLAKAEQLYRQGLWTCEAMTGKENLEVVKWLNLLAQVLKQQNKIHPALDIYRRTLAIRERILGETDHAVARTLNNLAILLEKTNQFGEAEAMYRRSLEISRNSHEGDHADVGTALNNLAGVLEKTGRFVEAEELYAEALRIMETANGPDHADTATLLHNLAVACKMQGRLDEAIQHYRRALNIREAALPGSSPALAKSQSSLAVALCMAKRYEQAEQLFRDALAFEQGYAAQNPTAGQACRSLGNTAAGLADCLVALRRYSDAVPLYSQAAECRESILGLDHPQVAATRLFQASAMRMCGDFEGAMDTLADARAHYEAIGESGVTGVIHADIEMSQCLVAMKDPEKAEIIMRKAHESHADNPDIPPIMAARIRWNLGNAILEKHGAEKSKEAEELGREAMEILQQSDGKNSPELVAPLHLVADVLKYQDDKELERNHLYQEIAAIENHSLANPREPGQDRNENADSKEVETMEVDEVQGVGEGPQPARQTAATPRPAAFAIGLRSPQLTQRHDSPVIREDADAEEAAMQQEYEIAFIEEKIEIAKKILPPVEVDAAAGRGRLELADSFDKSACRLSAQARLEDAIPLYRMSLDIRKKLLGQDHLAVATSLNNLGVGLKRKGHLQEAEDAYMHSLAIRKQALGEEHVIVAQSFHNLAALKEVMGEQQAAEELYRKAIKIREAELGEQSPKLASSLGNLGGLLESMGRYNEAESLYRQVLNIRTAIHKDDAHHPDVMAAQTRLALLLKLRAKLGESEKLLRLALKSAKASVPFDARHVAAATMNLASVRRAAEDYPEAEQLCRWALDMLENALGPVHQDVAAAQNNLADLLQCQGKLDDAEQLYKASISRLEEVLGPTHPALNTPISNLADLLAEKGQEQESRRWYKRAIEVTRSSAIGSTVSPQVATSANNQGVLQHEKGKLSAEPTLRRALEVREKVLGVNHPDVGDSLYALGTVLLEKGKLDEALPLLQQAVRVRERALGPTHPEVGSAMVALGDALQQTGDFQEAEAYYRKGVDIRKEILGRDHRDLVVLLNNLSVVMHKNGRNAQAEILQRRALEIGKEKLGSRHEQVATAMCNLAFLAAASGRLAEAEELLRRGLDIRREVLGITHPSLVLTLKNLAGVLEQREKHSTALELYTQAVVLKERRNAVDGMAEDPELLLLQAKVVELADRISYKQMSVRKNKVPCMPCLPFHRGNRQSVEY